VNNTFVASRTDLTAVTELIAELSTSETAANPHSSAPPLWKALSGSLPEPTATLNDLVEITRGIGYHATPGPIGETLLVARPLLVAAGLPVPEGPLSYAIGKVEARYAHPDRDSRVGPLGAAGVDAGLVVTGILPRVPWARTAAHIAVVAEAPFGPVLFLLDTANAELHQGVNLAGEPRDSVVLTGVIIPADRVRLIDKNLVSEARSRAALARAALIDGAAERCADLTARHITAREQFGRSLLSFQAVKQEAAKLIEEAALVRAAVNAAVAGLETGTCGGTATAAAKTVASDSVAEITRIAHQLHGAIGFTELSALRFASTRLWSWRDEDGSERDWAQQIGRGVLHDGPDQVWPLITGL
jgi:acyl-CoA dehydrogenase